MAMTAKSVLAACAAGVVGVGSVSGQVVEWTGGGLDNLWTNGANWDTGSPPGAANTARIGGMGFPDLTGIQSVSAVDVQDFTAGISVRLNSRLIVIGATATNNGIIELNRDNSASNSILEIPLTTTFSGSGAIQLLTSGDNSQIVGVGTLINGPAHAISGTGRVEVDWINQGFIRGDAGNGGVRTLELRAGGENQGLISAVQTAFGGSKVEVRGVPIVQTGSGSMSASDGGQIEFFGNTSVTGGTLNTAGGGFFDTTTGTISFTDVTNNGDLFVDANTTLAVFGNGFVNNGTTTVNNQNSASNGVVRFEESGTLSGSGEMLMRVNGDNSQLNTAVGATISHAASHTVRGVGQVNAAISNAGVIAADTAATFGTTTLELQTNDKSNSGLLEARAGSILAIENITIDQAGEGISTGRIESNDGDVRFFGSAAVLGGDITSSGAGTVRTVSAANIILDNLNLDADFFIDANSIVNVRTALTNNRTITLNNNNSSSNSTLTTDEDLTISGSGDILLRTGGPNSFISTSGAGRFTFGSGQFVAGAGEINANIVNNGVISADVSQVLSGAILELDVGPVVNNTLMTAEAGSELRVEDVVFTQAPAASIESNDGLVTLRGGSRLVGGTLLSTGGGLFRTQAAGSSEISGVTLNGTLQLEAGSVVTVDGAGIVNNGLIEINRNNSSSNGFLVLDGATVSGVGEIQLRTGGPNSFINTVVGGNSGTIGSGQLVRGAGVILGEIVNNGIIAADASITVSGTELELDSSDKVNNNQIRAEDGSILSINDLTVDQTGGGSIRAASGGLIRIDSNTTILGGTLGADAGGEWEFTFGQSRINNVPLDGTGAINAGTTLVILNDTLSNDGVITVNPQNSSSDALIQIIDDQVTTLAGIGEIDFRTAGLNNSRISPTTPGPTAGTIVNGPEHTLSGTGTLGVATLNEGTLVVGRPFGDFFAQEVVTLAASSTFGVRIGASGQNGQLDTNDAGAVAQLGGTIDVLLADGAVLTNGNNHVIIDGTYTGTFDTENVLVDGQLITRVRYETDQVVLRTRCRADTNLDGSVTPADFNSWIAAFNMQDSVADQNLDGLVSPSDFNAWIINFNTPCP